MSNKSAAEWDPRDPSVLRDQREAYDRMREECPVAFSDFLGWSVFRHGDIVGILDDPGAFSSRSRHLAIPNGMDPPEHTGYRELIEPFFGADAITALEPECRTIAAGLIEPLADRTGVDVIEALAVPLPLQTICRFLGWPIERWEHLRGWTHGNQLASFARDRESSAALAREFTGYVEDEIAARRLDKRVTSDDLMSRLMVAEVDGQPIGDEAIVSILRNWVAGQGTVAAGIGLLLYHLASDAELQDRLRESPERLTNTIDEILRVDGPLVSNRRTTTSPTTIDGKSIPEGGQLTLMWIAANRDPRAFAEPSTIDIERDQAGNLLFGHGIHDCVGAPLARMQMRVALEELFNRTTAIVLDDPDAVERMVYPSNGIRKMSVTMH
ncbi:MAG TPA: cytochrome P450 [Thermomicrobiales bacterium]|nr:cytochrome P450 [Thermomicrobiales bacterium]